MINDRFFNEELRMKNEEFLSGYAMLAVVYGSFNVIKL